MPDPVFINAEPVMVYFDRQKTQELREAIVMAKQRGDETFPFEGQTLLLTYAEYLLEHLEQRFGGN